ncbi:Hypothetical protein A7982_11239 [Minicystis rosea]|nr:Hypothetical protein A7982_11239 [Minicystis rosea]
MNAARAPIALRQPATPPLARSFAREGARALANEIPASSR